MLELIGLLAGLVACITIPYTAAKVRGGRVPKSFAGTSADYIVKFGGELRMIGLGALLLGAVIGLNALLGTQGDASLIFVVGLVFVAVGAISLVARWWMLGVLPAV